MGTFLLRQQYLAGYCRVNLRTENEDDRLGAGVCHVWFGSLFDVMIQGPTPRQPTLHNTVTLVAATVMKQFSKTLPIPDHTMGIFCCSTNV